jgi:phage replication O-like protein O
MSPQLENGHIRIANELFEAFYRCKLVEYERVVIMCIWRKTYGWGKTEDWISNTQIEGETGIALPNITRTMNSLIKKNIVKKRGKKLSVNKRYKEWLVEWRKVISPDKLLISPDNKKLSHQIPTKDNKDTIQKTTSESPDSQGLPDNQKDMAWNRQPDDFEEGVVDLDSGEVKQPVKATTRKYPNAPAIRKVFQEVLGRNPANWKLNKTELLACENLFTERGVDKVRNALEFYLEIKGQEYTPVIDSPYDLDTKYEKLAALKRKS